MNFFWHLLATIAVVVVPDFIWLTFVIDGLVDYPAVYNYGNKPNWAFPEIYYLVMSVWLAFGAAYKGMVYNDATPAFLEGWKAGFRLSVIYASIHIVFFQPWPMELIVIDVAWVTFSTAMAAVASYAIGVRLTSGGGSQMRRV